MNRKKINAKMVDMNNIIKQLDQQTSIEYSSQEQNTFFSSVHGTFSRINHVLAHKTNVNIFKRRAIIEHIPSHHNGMKLEITDRKELGNFTAMIKLKQHTFK